MKNRNWICYALDFFGIATLASAGLGLLAALWFAGTAAEALLMGSFRVAMMLAVGAFVASRSFEIFHILRAERSAVPAEQPLLSDNVESLPARRLPRAA